MVTQRDMQIDLYTYLSCNVNIKCGYTERFKNRFTTGKRDFSSIRIFVEVRKNYN